MKNANLVNRDRLDAMLSELAHECQTFFYLNGGAGCKECPYKAACDALNNVEIAVCVGDND